jgi:hypothetical protein
MAVWCMPLMPGHALGSSGVPQLFGDKGIIPGDVEPLGWA